MTDTRARGFWLHAAPQAYDLNVADWIASTKIRGARTESLNVRLWLKDETARAVVCGSEQHVLICNGSVLS